MIDSHVHYGLRSFDGRRQETEESDLSVGISGRLCLPVSFDDVFSMIPACSCFSHMKFAVGIHPLKIPAFPSESETEEIDFGKERKLCAERLRVMERMEQEMRSLDSFIEDNRSSVVAVGETGIDVGNSASNLRMQKTALRMHVFLSLRRSLPLILHLRGPQSLSEALSVFGSGTLAGTRLKGVWHCFCGSERDMEALLDGGGNDFLFGIGGMITYPERGRVLRRTLASLPKETVLSRIVLETDSPYLPPESLLSADSRAVNSSASIPLIAEAVAGIIGASSDEVVRRSDSNAERMFGEF